MCGPDKNQDLEQLRRSNSMGQPQHIGLEHDMPQQEHINDNHMPEQQEPLRQVAPAVIDRQPDEQLIEARLRCIDDIQAQHIDWSNGSADMLAVKEAVTSLNDAAKLSYALNTPQDIETFCQALDSIEERYITAIEKCTTYISNKDKTIFYYSKKRYAAVKNTRDSLRKEIGYIAAIRQDMLKDPGKYTGGMRVSFLDLAYDIQAKAEDPINQLTIGDFIKITSNTDAKTMLCRNGKLYRRNAAKAVDNPGEATRENYQMAKHFINILLQDQNIASDQTKEKIRRNLLYRLGVNLEDKTAAPISMQLVRELILDTTTQMSDTDVTLSKKKTDSVEYKAAAQVDRLLGKALLDKTAARQLKRQIRSIMETSERSGEWRASRLNSADMDYLLKGGIDTVRDRAYRSILRIYEGRQRLAVQEAADKPLLSDEEVKLLLSLAISETVSDDSVYQSLYATRINHYEEACTLKGNEALRAALNATRIYEFNCYTTQNIRDFYTCMPERLQHIDITTRRKGMEALCTITENMHKLMELEAHGVHQSLTQKELQSLTLHAMEIDRAYTAGKPEIAALISVLSANAGLRTAMEKLDGIYRNGGSITASITNQELLGMLQTAPAHKPVEEPEAKELISESCAARSIIETMSDKEQSIVRIFLQDKLPSDLIQTAKGRTSRELLHMHEVLSSLQENEEAEVTIKGVRLTFLQKDDILTLRAGSKRVVLPYNAAYWAAQLEDDLCANFEKYDEAEARALLEKVSSAEYNGQSDSRVKYEKFLTAQLGIPSDDLNLLDAKYMQYLVNTYCNGIDKDGIRNLINIRKREAMEQVQINSKAAMESLASLERLEKAQKERRVSDKLQHKQISVQENGEWTAQEKKLLGFIGEMYFSSKSAPDTEFAYTLPRLKKGILDNLEGFQIMCSLSLDQLRQLGEKFSVIPCFVNAYRAISEMVYRIYTINPPDIRIALQNGSLDELLEQTATNMTRAVNLISNSMQSLLTESVKNMEEEGDDGWKTLDDLTIEEILQKGMTGNEGEGSFNKKVLSGYIAQAKTADKQNMVAAAFKNAPNIAPDKLDYMTEDEEACYQGKFLSGYIKGAGPLLHKMMQGLAISNMPLMMQEAVKDVRSNLAPINEDIVDAQLNRIITDSKGAIDRIEKQRVLGAASVGETILVRVYEKGAPQGVDKVVKLLRPDVENRMSRELEFMENCAKEVDKEAYRKQHNEDPAPDYQGGMTKTFMNRVSNIKKELDLRTEAENIQAGSLYEDPLLHISTMKLDTRLQKSAGAIVLQRAPGESVDKFIAHKDAERQKLYLNGCKDTASLYSAMKDMDHFRKELVTKQRYLVSLARKWLEEALFGSGFFHGDLHAGNIMMDDNGVTVIDFGNVHKLDAGKRGDIMNLIAATLSLNTKRFNNHLEALLEGEAQTLYTANKAELQRQTKIILKKEDSSNPVQKILAVLNMLQNNGIGIPAGLYNFIQCFVRLAGTLVDYYALIDKVNDNMVKLMDRTRKGDITDNPDDMVMSLVSRNILQRNEEEYKDANAAPMDTYLEAAINGIVADTSLTKEYCLYKEEYILADMHDKPHMAAFYQLINPHALTFRSYIYGSKAPYFTQSRIRCVRYNTSLSHEALMQNMNQIQMLLNVSANSMKSAAAQEGMDIPQYEEWLRENPDKIAALEQQVAELAQQPASERLLQARTELDRYKSELQEAEEKLENLKQKVARHRNWAERLIEIAGQMRAHMTEPGYNRETAIADIDTFIQGFEPYLTEGLETEEAKEFMRAVLQLGGLDHEIDAVSEANRVEDLEDSEIVFAPLSEQDAQSLKQAKKTAADRLNAAAQKLYAKTNPKPYKTVLTETLLDAAKAQQMGNALQDWFADTRTDGDKLHTAYMALLAAHRNNRELTADSAEVIAARDALIQCIKLRAARLDSIMKNKNTSDKSIEIDAVLMKLLKGHWFSTLCRLDVCGMVYFKEYKLHQSDKDRIKRQAKERHSQYVERYLNDIRACALKDKLQELDDALLLYQNAPNQEKKRQAKQTINTTITAILRSLTHTISFRSPGKKLLASLLAEYEREPSTDALCKLFREANKYIRTQFQNTSFMDAGVNRQGRKVPSAYSSAYDDAFVTKELLVHLKDMEFGLNQTDQLDENRKPVKLIDRLNTDHNLQWLQ